MDRQFQSNMPRPSHAGCLAFIICAWHILDMLGYVPLWLDYIAYAYMAVAILSALAIAYDIFGRGNRQMMPIMDYVWPITALYLSLFGLWAYYDMGRPDSMKKEDMAHMHHMHMEHKKKSFWKSVFVSATHCGAGCEIGDFIGEWVIFLAMSGLLVAGSMLYTEYVIDFILAYLLGIMFQFMPIMQSRKTSVMDALRDAVKADSLSLLAFEVGLFGWMAIFNLLIFKAGVIDPAMPVYWFMMQIGMLLGHFTSYPANWMLVKYGVKSGM